MLVSLDLVKAKLHIDYDDDDASLINDIETAEEMVIGDTNRTLDELKAMSSDGVSFPKRLAQAVMLMVGHWYSNPEATTDNDKKPIPYGYEALVKPFVKLV